MGTTHRARVVSGVFLIWILMGTKMNREKFDVILDAGDENFTADLAKALGIKEGESINIITPQFERVDRRIVTYRPNTPEEYEAIKLMDTENLKKIGCQIWDDEGGKIHWLYPYEWYNHIPNGTEIIDICGNVEKFEHGKTDNDIRFGALSYGFIQMTDNQTEQRDTEAAGQNDAIVMRLFHATTPKKAKKYRETGHIKTPVRGFITFEAAMAWAVKTNRTVILEFKTSSPHKLPDHHNKFGEAWWNDGDVSCDDYKCVFSADSDA